MLYSNTREYACDKNTRVSVKQKYVNYKNYIEIQLCLPYVSTVILIFTQFTEQKYVNYKNYTKKL